MKLAAKRTEDNTRRSMEENMELQSHCRALEEDLRLEKEWRTSLQDSIVSDRTTMAELQQQIEETHEIRIVLLLFILLHIRVQNSQVVLQSHRITQI